MNVSVRKITAVFLIWTLFFSSFTTIIFAVEDQFEVLLSVTSNDTTAPSVPSGLSSTAVSTSQINLSWAASTDNVAVTGYHVFRDNSLIATSTLTIYSDTGLVANTAYSYAVSAIDAVFNESARSATSTATTLSEVVVDAGGGGGGGSSTSNPLITNLQVFPGLNQALITWDTRKETISTVSWGQTQNYELGLSAEAFYLNNHQIVIPNLQAGTDYFFRIEITDGGGRKNFVESGFRTLGIAEDILNPINFRATPREKSIDLSWNNPSTPNFEEVRILRSTKFYPADPFDGEVVYEGRDEFVTDVDTVAGTRYYYTIFAKNKDGQYSSGVVVNAQIALPGEPPPKQEDVFESLPKAPSVHPIIQKLSLFDFDFIQDGERKQLFDGDTVLIDGNKNLTVSLDYSKVPEILKSVVVTLSDPQDDTKTFSFLLRVNSEKSRYVATIGALGKTGTFGVGISIVDFKNQGLKKIKGSLLASSATASEGRSIIQNLNAMIIENFWKLIIALLLLAFIAEGLKKIFKKNRKTDKYNENKEEREKAKYVKNY